MSDIPPEDLDWENAKVMEPRSHIATYNLQVFSPKPEEAAPSVNDTEKRVLADLPAMMEAIEEEFAKFLPEGYRVQITEWNAH